MFSLGAPKIIIYNEGRQLAAAIVLHEYGISREVVDNNIRLRLERMELMSDEELDELYRPQKTNTRKSMAPYLYMKYSEINQTIKHTYVNKIL